MGPIGTHWPMTRPISPNIWRLRPPRVLSGVERTIATHLIDQLDEAGYLTVSLEEIADRLGVAVERVESVLAVVQSFDPTGVGARDLAECGASGARGRSL